MKIFLFLLIVFNVYAGQTVLISDIDDTIKITAVKNPRIIGFAARDEEFAGLSALYSYFLCHLGPIDCLDTGGRGVIDKNVIYVTGQPGKLHKLGDKFLRKNKYPNSQNILWKDAKESTLDFKKNIIEKYISSHSPDNKYILIGDNGEYDPLVYQYIHGKFSTQIIATFIHMLYQPSGVKHLLLENQVAYLTSVDLAVHFYNLRLIDGEKLQKIIDLGNKEVKGRINNIVKPWFACKYFNHMNWFPQLSGSKSLDGFKKSLFESRDCQ